MSVKQQLFILRKTPSFWLLTGTFIAIVVCALYGVLRSWNGPVYAVIAQHTQNQATNIVVIETNDLVQEQHQLIEKVKALSPKAVVVFSSTLDSKLKSPSVLFVGSSPANCPPLISPWLNEYIVYNPPANHCHLWLQTLFTRTENMTERLIDFSLPFSALPKFTSQRVLADDIFKEQFADKIILVTQSHGGFEIPFNAPQLSHSTNPVFLYAYLLHNLDKQIFVSLLSPELSATLQVIFFIFLLFVLQKYVIDIGAAIALLTSIMWLLIGYLLVVFANTLIPIVQLILLTWLSLASVLLHNKYKQDRHLSKLINNLNQRMFGRYLPKSIIEQSSPWESVLSLVNQQLSLNRGMFLARVESDHRLYEIQAINCQLNDIEELRRDYERPPYSDAIKELGAIKIARPFFKGLNSNELQYIAPLMYAGDIRGFWVMTVNRQESFNEAAFIHNVNRFASQIGELLYHYHISAQIQQSQSQTLTRVLTLNLSESPSRKVQSAIASMEQKLSTLEHLFNHLNSAVIMFNLFGQVVEVNKAFEQLAAKQNLKTFGMSAFDLLMHSCQFNADTTKGKLRYLTLHKGRFTRLVEFGTHQYILTVMSVDKIETSSQTGSPFSVSGILFEFIDITYLLATQDDPNIVAKLRPVTLPNNGSDTDSWSDA